MDVVGIVYYVILIFLYSVNLCGFFILWFKRRKPLFLWVACFFAITFVDTGICFIGRIIPELNYFKTAGNSKPAIIFLRELMTVGCFYCYRRISADAVGVHVKKAENWCWLGVVLAVVLVKWIFDRFEVYFATLTLYIVGILVIWAYAFLKLRHRRASFEAGEYRVWFAIFLTSLVCYFCGAFFEYGILFGGHIKNYFGEILSWGYSCAGVAYLIFVLSRKQTENDDLKYYALKRRYALTDRELDVLRQLLQGKTNQEIGDCLYIAHGTVKVHIYNIYQKLGVNRRAQLFELLQNTQW